MGTDGKQRYVKFYKNPTQAWDEKLTNDIYRDLKIGAPQSVIFARDNGDEGYASEIIPGKLMFMENSILNYPINY
jgi:hypothetical protein